jgi:hypothetical protein
MKWHQHMAHKDKLTEATQSIQTGISNLQMAHDTPSPPTENDTRDTTKTRNTILQWSKRTSTGATPTTLDSTHSDEQQGKQPAPSPTSLTHEQWKMTHPSTTFSHKKDTTTHRHVLGHSRSGNGGMDC